MPYTPGVIQLLETLKGETMTKDEIKFHASLALRLSREAYRYYDNHPEIDGAEWHRGNTSGQAFALNAIIKALEGDGKELLEYSRFSPSPVAPPPPKRG